eukprot:gnl/TRDRNA2_/TRDRNA2_157607_c0_seq1.p1 gnl/TRDRNA2_/TRDRNA2_157607_c0~~gnl/TRDRNA2_/TRDRNA2_157607_c0_seq1.p1  ORF type:complete len:365 (+),score=36.42 gnl/TRDRNA2_/TRDRNA2_157607_c0_seq1:161-1255(+)
MPGSPLNKLSSSSSSSRACDVLVEIPKSCLCALTQEVMEDPVVCADGTSYEREYIEHWFARGHITSPQTNLNLPHRTLIPNHSLRGVIEELKSKMPLLQQQQIEMQREKLKLETILDAVETVLEKNWNQLSILTKANSAVDDTTPGEDNINFKRIDEINPDQQWAPRSLRYDPSRGFNMLVKVLSVFAEEKPTRLFGHPSWHDADRPPSCAPDWAWTEKWVKVVVGDETGKVDLCLTGHGYHTAWRVGPHELVGQNILACDCHVVLTFATGWPTAAVLSTWIKTMPFAHRFSADDYVDVSYDAWYVRPNSDDDEDDPAEEQPWRKGSGKKSKARGKGWGKVRENTRYGWGRGGGGNKIGKGKTW